MNLERCRRARLKRLIIIVRRRRSNSTSNSSRKDGVGDYVQKRASKSLERSWVINLCGVELC